MNPNPSNLRDLVVDVVAILFFFGVAALKLMPATTAAAFVMSIGAGRLGLAALVQRPKGEAAPGDAAPAAAAACSSSSSSSGGSKLPPTSGVLFLLLGVGHALSVHFRHKGA